MAEHGYPLLFNYIDDLIYTGLPSKMDACFNFLKDLLTDLGLEISPKKLVPPATSVTCLGILIDSIQKTVSIPQEKLAEITQLCKQWTTKTLWQERLTILTWVPIIRFQVCKTLKIFPQQNVDIVRTKLCKYKNFNYT